MTKLLAVFDGNDNLHMLFEYADGRMPLAMMKDGLNYYLCYDQVGSLRLVTDTLGNVMKELDYDSFGNVLLDSDSTFMVPFGFAGGLYDVDTGLVHFGYRDYDPDTGRWAAKDPIFFRGEDTNLYGYVLNDPINSTDQEGTGAAEVLSTASTVVNQGTFLEAAAECGSSIQENNQACNAQASETTDSIVANFLQQGTSPPPGAITNPLAECSVQKAKPMLKAAPAAVAP